MDQLQLNDVPSVPKRRGRPSSPNSMTAAERKRNQRTRHDLAVLSVEIPTVLFEALSEYMKFKDLTKNQVIENLLTKQLLRKR